MRKGPVIRRMAAEDLELLHGLLSDARVMRFLEPPFTREATARFLENAGLTEPPLIYAVDDEHGRFVGYVIYHDHPDGAMELGWVLKPEVWGRGYASALTAELIEKARSARRDVLIECAPGQEATKHIARKFGFSHVGRRNGLDVFRLSCRKTEQA